MEINKLAELDKLEEYLKEKKIPYERIDEDVSPICHVDRHQICSPNRAECEWDVICHFGSYGYEQGLLEVMGSILNRWDDGKTDVLGYLTAEDIIMMIEKK